MVVIYQRSRDPRQLPFAHGPGGHTSIEGDPASATQADVQQAVQGLCKNSQIIRRQLFHHKIGVVNVCSIGTVIDSLQDTSDLQISFA